MRRNDGRLIKAARVYYEMSQKDLAKKLKCDQTTISAMETEGRQNVFYLYIEEAIKELRLEDPKSPFVRAVLTQLVEHKK